MLIPYRVSVYTERVPLVNYLIIGVTILLSVLAFFDTDLLLNLAGAEASYSFFGEITALRLKYSGIELIIPAITCTFAHGGIMHLLGNMIFLWVFGNAINSKFGHLQYLLVYLLCAIGGAASHYLIHGSPAIGASGAIFGIMGLFLFYFPRNDVDMMWVWWWPFTVRIFEMSSFWIMLGYVFWNVLLLLAIGTERSGVGIEAHLSGFLTGLALAWVVYASGYIRPTQDEQTIIGAVTKRFGV